VEKNKSFSSYAPLGHRTDGNRPDRLKFLDSGRASQRMTVVRKQVRLDTGKDFSRSFEMTNGNSTEEIRSMLRSSFPNKVATKLRLRLSAGKNLLVTEYFPNVRKQEPSHKRHNQSKNAHTFTCQTFSLFHFWDRNASAAAWHTFGSF